MENPKCLLQVDNGHFGIFSEWVGISWVSALKRSACGCGADITM